MGRLIDRGPHTVVVTPRRLRDGGLFTSSLERAVEEPITVHRVRVQPDSLRGAASRTSVKESQYPDAGMRTMRSHWSLFGGGTWPGKDGDLVEVTSGPTELGRAFRQEGDPEYHGFTRRTEYYSVLLRALAQDGGVNGG